MIDYVHQSHVVFAEMRHLYAHFWGPDGNAFWNKMREGHCLSWNQERECPFQIFFCTYQGRDMHNYLSVMAGIDLESSRENARLRELGQPLAPYLYKNWIPHVVGKDQVYRVR